MNGQLPILAGFDPELVMVVIFIVISIISALGKVMGKGKGKNQQQARHARPQAPRPQQPAPGVGRPQAGGMEDEIGEFLRRAAQGRGGDRAAAPPPVAQRPTARPAPQRPSRPVARPPQRPIVAEVAHERLAQERPIDAETTKTARRFSGRAKELGKAAAQADAQSDQHMHEAFDHDVSSLADTSIWSEDARREAVGKSKRRKTKMPQTAAAGVAAMLADAQGIRQAILINEILQRPTDRWS